MAFDSRGFYYGPGLGNTTAIPPGWDLGPFGTPPGDPFGYPPPPPQQSLPPIDLEPTPEQPGDRIIPEPAPGDVVEPPDNPDPDIAIDGDEYLPPSYYDYPPGGYSIALPPSKSNPQQQLPDPMGGPFGGRPSPAVPLPTIPRRPWRLPVPRRPSRPRPRPRVPPPPPVVIPDAPDDPRPRIPDPFRYPQFPRLPDAPQARPDAPGRFPRPEVPRLPAPRPIDVPRPLPSFPIDFPPPEIPPWPPPLPPAPLPTPSTEPDTRPATAPSRQPVVSPVATPRPLLLPLINFPRSSPRPRRLPLPRPGVPSPSPGPELSPSPEPEPFAPPGAPLPEIPPAFGNPLEAPGLTPFDQPGVESSNCETPRERRERQQKNRDDCTRFIKIKVKAHTKRLCVSELVEHELRKLKRKAKAKVKGAIKKKLVDLGVPAVLLKKRKRFRLPTVKVPGTDIGLDPNVFFPKVPRR